MNRDQEILREAVERAVQEITERTAGIRLRREKAVLAGETRTISVSFTRGAHFTLSLRAELPMLVRLTRNMMQEEEVTPQNVEDFSKEYFNVLCGRVAALLYKATRAAFRFTVPVFYAGDCPPQGEAQLVLSYASDREEHAQLIQSIPSQSDGPTDLSLNKKEAISYE